MDNYKIISEKAGKVVVEIDLTKPLGSTPSGNRRLACSNRGGSRYDMLPTYQNVGLKIDVLAFDPSKRPERKAADPAKAAPAEPWARFK